MRHVTTTMRNGMSLVTLTHRVIDFHSQCVFNLSTVSIEIMSGPGDEVTFLKKTHQLLSDGRMIIRIHPKHLELCKLLHCQNVCRTRDLLATAKLKLPTPLKSWTNTMLQCIDPALGSSFTCLQICRNANTWSDISQHVHRTHSQSYGGLEAPGWLHGRSLWPICCFEMERHALRLATWLWVWKACSGNLQSRRLRCRQKHTQIGFWQCNRLWWMPSEAPNQIDR